jgi:hypothetical protein
MAGNPTQRQTLARLALATIRLTVGTTALFAPRAFARHLDVDAGSDPAVIYVARLFGIRTIFIGTDILLRDEALRAQALRTGVVIHLSDATAAAIAALFGQIPRRAAVKAMILSSINAALAIIAQRR